jgi:hypothetical protein
MTIKTECVIKSLKSDYSIIAKYVIGIGICIGICIGLIYGVVAHAYVFTAFNTFIIMEIIILFAIPLLIAFNIGENSKENIKKSENTPFLVLINSLVLFLIYMLYVIESYNGGFSTVSKYPDVTLLFIAFIIIGALVIDPLAVAYARCKE